MNAPRTLAEFRHITLGLTEAEAGEAFRALPEDAQAAIWADLARTLRENRRESEIRDEARFRLGDLYSREELADAMAQVAAERGDTPPTPRQQPRASTPNGSSHSQPLDMHALRQIPSAEYVTTLTGREVEHDYAQCPLHADGHERTPSLHVSDTDGAWWCHACATGGGLLEFYAALNGETVPDSGAPFIKYAWKVAEAVK